MSTFAAAIELIFADPNMAADALWLPAGVPPGQPVRVIRRAQDEVTDYGGARIWSETSRVDVRVSDVPAPAPGDVVEIAGERFTVQGEPLRDREQLVWAVDLRAV